MGIPSDQRPDPDLLLAKVNAQEAEARRGKLRIYFGSSAGVGKTYAMLVAARKLTSEGRTVLVGVVETHGRAETAALLEGSADPAAEAYRLSRQDAARIRSGRGARAPSPTHPDR